MGRRRVGGVSSTGRRAAPFLDATDLAMQAAVEFHHRILGFFWGQWRNYGLSLGISSVLGRAGGQGGQGLSIWSVLARNQSRDAMRSVAPD